MLMTIPFARTFFGSEREKKRERERVPRRRADSFFFKLGRKQKSECGALKKTHTQRERERKPAALWFVRT